MRDRIVRTSISAKAENAIVMAGALFTLLWALFLIGGATWFALAL